MQSLKPHVCVAFAPQLPNCNHPAQPELVWHVWDSKVLSHLEDPEACSAKSQAPHIEKMQAQGPISNTRLKLIYVYIYIYTYIYIYAYMNTDKAN